MERIETTSRSKKTRMFCFHAVFSHLNKRKKERKRKRCKKTKFDVVKTEAIQWIWKEYRKEEIDLKSVYTSCNDSMQLLLEEFQIDYKKNFASLFDLWSTELVARFYKFVFSFFDFVASLRFTLSFLINNFIICFNFVLLQSVWLDSRNC